ncbi:MAG: response regulator [Nitrospirota bacterium]
MAKVLIADDSIAVRKVAERLLTEAGFGVTLAANGEEALACLSKEIPDLVVTDVIMPDKSGYEVCAFVRAQRTLANTPVLLISGIVNDEVTKQAEACHADGVLKKPFQGTSLKDRVIELLAKRQSVVAPSAEKVTEFIIPTLGVQVSKEQGEFYRQAFVRLKPLEEELLLERERAAHSAQRIAELEGQVGRVQELESALAMERGQTAQMKRQLVEADNATARVQELESVLKTERGQMAEVKNQASLVESLGERVRELEMALQKERDERAEEVACLTELQKNASRAKELEEALHAERQAATQLVEQITEMEQGATRSQMLAQEFAQALAAEQETSKGLAVRLSDAERALENATQNDTLLQTERERNSLLMKRVSESEHASEQATNRFEEMARKLGEIAELASQLGNGKRRS